MTGIYTDSSYPMRKGPKQARCILCNCYFEYADLSRHQNGRRHLRNVESTGFQQSHPSQMTSNIQSALPANISPPVGVNISTCYTDPRVKVSGEGGLYFFVEGSGTSGNPISNHNILIEKTNLPSGYLSLKSLALTPPLGSWFELLWSLYS
jgi:hypothetical protein